MIRAWPYVALALAGCADLFNLAVVPDAGPQDGAPSDAPPDVLVDVGADAPGEAGCADGTREGFTGASVIAGCSGAWDQPGLRGVQPMCGRAAGNNGTNLLGEGCTAADLCADGWEICQTRFDVASNSPSQGCAGVGTAPNRFFATAQSGDGAGECDATNTDDLFGCGTMGAAVTSPTCYPLTHNSSNMCTQLPVGGWSCPQFDAELLTVTKTEPFLGGGVLCCSQSDPP